MNINELLPWKYCCNTLVVSRIKKRNQALPFVENEPICGSMASVIASPIREFPKKLPALPVIEHPALRRSSNNNELQVRGSSRQEEHDVLPPLKSRRRSKAHSRVLTWPLEQEKGKTNSSPSLDLPAHKRTPEELEELIREKLATRINGLRQAFRSNDPLGKGNVSREALVTILYHLCGYLSPDQISALWKRLGLETQSTISFEEFVNHFRDNSELLTREWVDPVLRPNVDQDNLAKLPANRLRQRQREIAMEQKHAAFKQGRKQTPPKFYSALEVFPQLKIRAQQGTLPYQKIFPPSIFDVDGMVLKPQLRTALQLLGFQMFEEEFDKVWDRFDRTGLGTVDSLIFFRTLGLNPFHEHRRMAKQPSPLIETESEDKIHKEKQEPEEKTNTPHSDPLKDIEFENKKSEDLESVRTLFSAKFKEGYTRVLDSCSKYDLDGTGQISKADFRKVLSEYHLQLGVVEVEHFLQRCGMRDQTMVPYRKLMDMFLDRSEHGRLQIVLDDPKHRFNSSRDSAIGNTTAFDAEARLLDILQSDFLALLGAFKQLDRDDLGVIKRYQFKELLETRFKMNVSNEELSSILRPILENSRTGLVPYARFLELFSSSRKNTEAFNNLKPPSAPTGDRPSTSPIELKSPRSLSSRCGLDRSATFVSKKNEPEPRNVHLLFSELRELLTDKFQAINKIEGAKMLCYKDEALDEVFSVLASSLYESEEGKTFLGMDQIRRGYLSKGMFRRLFERYELQLTSWEVDLLWSKLPVDKDGTLSFVELVQQCFMNFNTKTPDVENKTGTLSRFIQDYAKSMMRKGLEPVAEEKEETDSLPTPPSQVVEEVNDSPRVAGKAFSPLKATDKPNVEAVLKRIKQEVCSQWTEIREAFVTEDKEGSATLDFSEVMIVMKKFCKNVTDEECESICLKFDKRKDGRVRYLEFLKHFLPTMPVKAQDLVPLSRTNRTRTQVAWSESDRGQEAIDAIVRKIRNQMISDWKGLRRSFKKLDSSGGGLVSVTDFRAALNKFNFPLNEEDFYHIFSVFDENITGRISYEEFMKRSLRD